MKAKLLQSSFLIVSALMLGACAAAKGDAPDALSEPMAKPVQGQTLQKAKLGQTLELTGSISGQNQTVLSAKAPGRIEAVYADIGDTVKKGELLVQLGGDEMAVTLQNARSNHQNMLASAERTRTLMGAQVQSAEQAINTLKVRLQTLENTKKSTDDITARQVALAEHQVVLIETRLANVNRSLDKGQADVAEQKLRLITQATILTHSMLDQLLGMVNVSAGNLKYETDLENRFGQASHQSRSDTLSTLKALRDSVETLRAFYDQTIKPGNVSDQEIQKGFDLAKGALEETKNALEVVHGLFLHTVASDKLSHEQLDSLRTAVTQLGQQAENLLLSVSGGQVVGFEGLSQAQAGIDVDRENQQAEFRSQLSIANQQLALALETRRQQLSDLDDNRLILQSQIAEAENARQVAMASRDAQVQLLITQADLARGQLAMAEVAYQNTLVKAPADGIIISRMAEEGTVVAAGMPLMEFADPGRLKIDSEVTEAEAAQLIIGMTATFTVDSLPEQTFSARLARLAAHADPITRKVPLEFDVTGNRAPLKIGAFVRLKMALGESGELILVPDQALLRNGERESVFIIQNGAAYEVAVKTGRRHSDEIEVMSGLYAGNQVVVSGLEGLQSGDLIELTPTHD